jgi:uncharacterized protein (DUF924 family)
MRSLAKSASGEDKPAFDDYADYARRHHAVIERFGRFPIATASWGARTRRKKPNSSSNRFLLLKFSIVAN